MMRETGKQESEPFYIFTRNVPCAFLCTGTIPASIGGLTNLQTLWLNGNALSGMCVFILCRFSATQKKPIEK